jgi:hypothetical protein
MVRAFFALAVIGVLGWFVYDRLELNKTDVPAPVEYPVVGGGGDSGVGGVGTGAGGLLTP